MLQNKDATADMREYKDSNYTGLKRFAGVVVLLSSYQLLYISYHTNSLSSAAEIRKKGQPSRLKNLEHRIATLDLNNTLELLTHLTHQTTSTFPR